MNAPSNRSAAPPSATLKIETRSIDYVPRNERHGKVWHQAPFWFTGNFVLTTLVTGFTGAALGLSLVYAILAIVIGVCLGTFAMAFHANQGPRMGLPQMIQSRAQFGLRGAIVPFIAVVFVYIGFNVFNVILATDAINTVLPGNRAPWYALMIILAVVIAVIGHDLLHTVQRWLTYVMISVFAVLTVAAVMYLQADTAVVDAHFSWSAFLIQLSAAAGYQISYAVYVSDYSRYLPHNTPSRSVIFWTYLGAAGSALWLMSLGAFLASALPSPDAIGSVQAVGNQLLPGFGTFTVLIAVPALVGIMAVNCYGAMLTGISAIDGFVPIKPRIRSRIVGISLVAVVIFCDCPEYPRELPEQLQHLRPLDAVFPGALDSRQPRRFLCHTKRALRNQRHFQPGRYLWALVERRAHCLFPRPGGNDSVYVAGFLSRTDQRDAGRRRCCVRRRPGGLGNGLLHDEPPPRPRRRSAGRASQ